MKNKNDLIGKKIKDSVVVDYDSNGLFVKDKYGVEKYIKDEDTLLTQEEFEMISEHLHELTQKAKEAKDKSNQLFKECANIAFGGSVARTKKYIKEWLEMPEHSEFKEIRDKARMHYNTAREVILILDPNSEYRSFKDIIENEEQAELAYQYYENLILYGEEHYKILNAILEDLKKTGEAFDNEFDNVVS